jgi:hypothetical protein
MRLARPACAVAVASALVLTCDVRDALAVRPFVTDDARVIDKGLFLLETSGRWDRTRVQNLNLLAYSFVTGLETTIGFADGVILEEGEHKNRPAIAGPLLQLKYLFTQGTPNGYPGVALAAGSSLPFGTPGFAPPSASGFAFLALTESFGENEAVNIHANVGAVVVKPEAALKTSLVWGIGPQVRIYRGLHSVSEIISGDPYSAAAGGAFQIGFRQFLSDRVQVDGNLGSGLWGDPKLPIWVGAGLRVIFDPPWGG